MHNDIFLNRFLPVSMNLKFCRFVLSYLNMKGSLTGQKQDEVETWFPLLSFGMLRAVGWVEDKWS